MRLLFAVAILLVVAPAAPAQISYHPGAAPEDSTGLQQLFEAGQADARRDLAGGIVKIKQFGLPMNWDPLYAQMVAERYGVEIEFGPDVVMPREDAYWNGYNEIVFDSLRQTYDSNFLTVTYSEAIRDYRRVRPGETMLNPEIIRGLPLTNEAKKAGVTGFVAVRFDITPDGTTSNIEIIRGRGYGLDERAIEAVEKLRFEPAKDQENAVPLKGFSVPVRFVQE